jgi:two-component system response regulator
MTQPLAGKHILIVEDEPVFRSLLDSWLSSLGATTALAGDGIDALEILAGIKPDLMICDLAMPRMNGLALVEHLRNEGDQTPVLVISATENMADIAKALRLGVQDVLLKPVKDLDRLRETVFACLYPNMFNSRVEEEERLFQDWDALVNNPLAAAKLLKELQPPVQQNIANCRINYRQLVAADQPGLVLDIAPLSDNDLAFYCLDVTRAGDNGVLAALLLRALFNGLLQEQLSHQLHPADERVC